MLRLRLLGEPAVVTAEPAPAMRLWRPHVALLARLALASGGILSRGVLVELLWPGASGRSGRGSLRQAIFRLRRELGDVVIASGDALQLDDEHLEIDVQQFERLLDSERPVEAIEQYRGPFLDGFSLPSSPSFDQWADRERTRLAGRAAAAYASLSDSALTAGRWAEGMRRTQQWLALEPWSEAAAERMMALRAQSGDVGEALAFYQQFRARLRHELSLDPGPALQGLAERLRKSPPRPAERTGTRAYPASDLPLVGRDAEFERIAERWEAAGTGARQLVLLTGEPGMGKTRLVREFAGWARVRGATTLYGRAYRIEQTVPYAALAGILNAALEAPGLAAVDAASLGEISRIVPEMATHFRGGVAAPSNDLETGRVRLLEALRLLVDNLAYEAPVLLVLDDLPWADEATLTALHYVWRRLPAARLLLLTTARDLELSASAALERMLGDLAREDSHQAERIPLTPLGTAEIVQLAVALGTAPAEHSDRESLSLLVERESGGNPLFVLESLRARAECSPTATEREPVRTGVAELTADLSTAARRFLDAAAVLGRHFPLPLAAAVASLSHDDSIDGLEELLRRRLLQRVGYEYDFVHDLLRESVYDSMGAERRRLLHRRAFERLRPGEGESVGLDRANGLAMHATRGDLAAAAHAWLLRAADLARGVFAGEEAERLLTEAVTFAGSAAEQRTVWEKTGDLRHARSRFGAAALAYQRAISYTESATETRLSLRIKLLDASLRAGLLSLPQDASAAAALLEDAAEAGSAFHRDALMTVANAFLRARDLERAEEHALQAVEAARRAEDSAPLVRALLLRAQVATLRRAASDALAVLEEALRTAARDGLERERWDVETEYATELCRQGRWTEAMDGWGRVLGHRQTAGAVGAAAIAHLNLSDVLLRRGEWAEAADHLEEAQALAERWDFPHVLVDVLVNRALMARHQEDHAGTIREARRALAHARGLGMTTAEDAARALLALGLLETGDVAGARGALDSGLHRPEVAHPTWGDDRELTVVARARLLAVDEGPAAGARVIESVLPGTTEPYAAALLRLELARLRLGVDPATAERLAREAEALLLPLEARPLTAASAELLRSSRAAQSRRP